MVQQAFSENDYEDFAAGRADCVTFPEHCGETHLLSALKFVSRDNIDEVFWAVLGMPIKSFNAQFDDATRLTLLKYTANYVLQG